MIHPSCYIHPSAVLIGDVTIGESSSVFPHAVLRGDQNSITIGKQSNIQDCCVLHVNTENPLSIADEVSVGHAAILHGATIHDCCIIGMNATIMNGAIIGEGSIIGAHALVTEKTEIPANSLVIGIPGKVKNQNPSYRDLAQKNAATYTRLAKNHKKGMYPLYHPS